MEKVPYTVQQLSNKYSKAYQVFLVTGHLENDQKTLELLVHATHSPKILPLIFINYEGQKRGAIQYCQKLGITNYEIYNIECVNSLLFNQHHDEEKLNYLRYYDDNYFLLIVSLLIARAEAVGAKKIWIPLDANMLKHISYSVTEYICALKKLSIVGALYNDELSLEFPLVGYEDRVELDCVCRIEKKKKEETTILYSGGLDSTAAACIMQKLGKKLHLLNIQYGQSNRVQEKICMEKGIEDLSKNGEIEFESIYFECIKQFGGSVIIDDSMKLVRENSHLEYVPFRNTIFINLAIMYSLKKGIFQIVTGGHKDDKLSPDNNLQYFNVFQEVLKLQYSTKEVELYPVLLHLGGKPELIKALDKLHANFENTWSCLSNLADDKELINCGECGNCSTRYWAFMKAGITDPIPYRKIPYERKHWSGWTDDSVFLLKELEIEIADSKITMENENENCRNI